MTTRIVSAPSAEGLYDLLVSLNDSGHHPELACLIGGCPFLAVLWDVDYAGQTHYVHTDADSGQEHCCGCSDHHPTICDHASWTPPFPVDVVLTHDPDPADTLSGPAPAWWRADQ